MHIKELIPDIYFYYFLIKNKRHILKLTCSKRITYILKILNLILLCVEIFDLLFCVEPIEALCFEIFCFSDCHVFQTFIN